MLLSTLSTPSTPEYPAHTCSSTISRACVTALFHSDLRGSSAGPSPVPVQMWERVSPTFEADLGSGEPQSRCRRGWGLACLSPAPGRTCGRGEPSPVADVGGRWQAHFGVGGTASTAAAAVDDSVNAPASEAFPLRPGLTRRCSHLGGAFRFACWCGGRLPLTVEIPLRSIDSDL